MAEKTKGWDLSEKLAGVSKLDTGADSRPKLEYIDIDLIDPDPENRKNLEGIDKLAQNILLVGLQQPLAVRKHPDVAGRYMAVSGHRRRLAIKSLVDGGEEKFRLTPCLVAEEGESPALTRLKLLSGNIVTQVLSSAEMAEATKEFEDCIYKLKEEGYEFHGKVRDLVADTFNIASSRLARLKVIREKLIDDLKKDWEGGDLSESVAYAFAQQTPEVQRLTVQQLTDYGVHNLTRKYWNENSVKFYAKKVSAELKPRKGPKGSCDQCDATEGRLKRMVVGNQWNDHCADGKCCHCCPNLGDCAYACPHLSNEASKARESAKAKKAKEKEEQKKRDAEIVAPDIRLWKRFGEARVAAGLTWEEYTRKAGVDHFVREKKVADFEQGQKITPTSGGLPYTGGNGLDWWRIKPLIKAADALGCSIDYLLCRTDEPQPVASTSETVISFEKPQWNTGTPGVVGSYYCQVDIGGERGKNLLHGAYWWNGESWLFKQDGADINYPVVGWWPLPDAEWCNDDRSV